MDRPLLALTRRHATPLGPSPDAIAADNMRQLIQLRWLAVSGQLVTILIVGLGLKVRLPLGALLTVVVGLALANFAGTLLLNRHRVTNIEMLLALLFDVGSLTLQLYLSGGSTNPFISLYLVQLVLGAILLQAWSVWLLVVVTCLCFATLTVRYVPLVFPPGLLPDIADLYALGSWLSFALVCTLLVLFSTRISRNLRARDAYLADMRQRVVEEDHIVRMGLFASGAAHELGTPLASISVILGDWQRMPRLAADPELAGEIVEMQAEVQRCKTIVTDILHSVGEPRGEALGNTAAAAFLDEVVEAWREHPHAPAPLDYTRDGLDQLSIVADPALRQAIWNLLDNAAEASPDGIVLRAVQVPEGLDLCVQDRGAGFPPDILPTLGQPYCSSKGEGHGMGLFLVNNVARRLGGHVHAANRPDGGAVVRLVLPVTSTLLQKC
ncbi:MAG: ATP-binding protein [Janthinobacterium lividum]